MPLSSKRAGLPALAAMLADSRTSPHPSLAGHHRKIVEMHIAVRLRPQADLSRDGLWQRVLKIELAIEIAFNLVAGDANFQVMPLSGCRRAVATPSHRRTAPLSKLPHNELCFRGIG